MPLLQSATSSNKFERGQVDEFVVSCGDLGEIEKLRIGHDGSGPGAGWHLAEVHKRMFLCFCVCV